MTSTDEARAWLVLMATGGGGPRGQLVETADRRNDDGLCGRLSRAKSRARPLLRLSRIRGSGE